MIRCLLVDDDAEIRTGVQSYLQGFGFDVTAVGDGAGLRRAITAAAFDIVILDLMLPDESGLDLCRWLRGKSDAAVVMLTALGDPISRVLGLELGADDYMAKPFEPRELLLRVNSILRRAPAPEEPERLELKFGPCRYDLARHQLTMDGQPVHLTSSEAELLRILADHVNEPVDRMVLAAAAEDGSNPRTIDVQITRLRRKLEVDPRQPRYLQTVRGTGYLLRAD